MSIKKTHPELVEQWVQSTPSNTALEGNFLACTPGSKKRFTWRCTKHDNHIWDTSVHSRTQGYGCPYCANRKVLTGYNDLATKIPSLVSRWNYELNHPLTPQDVLAGSVKKYWWTCPKGHTTHGNIYSRKVKKTSEYTACAMCSGHISIPGETDILTTNPDVAAQFISDVDIRTVTPQSSKIFQWKCEYGHIDEESPKSRLKRNKNGDRTYCKQCKANSINKRKKEKEDIKRKNQKESRKSFLSAKNKDLFNQLVDKKRYEDISYNSARKVMWMCDKKHTWESTVYQRYNGNSGCPECLSHLSTSKGEKEVAEFIKSIYFGRVIENTRSIIKPHELDIYIPEKNLAVEFNGCFWHSDIGGKPQSYHYDKWKKCQEEDIQLIQVWDDDWRDKQDIVKSMISHKMGLSDGRKVFARNTSVEKISYQETSVFCEQYHIQGAIQGSAYLSLKEESTGDIVAVSVWRKRGKDLLLERYCTSIPVVGGMGKLLRAGIHYARDMNMENIITFSDHEVSDGGLYEKLGFIKDKEIKPDYKYVIRGTREHKFGYRKKRFQTDPKLKYQEGLSESQLAVLNNIPKVYDSGKTRWKMVL